MEIGKFVDIVVITDFITERVRDVRIEKYVDFQRTKASYFICFIFVLFQKFPKIK